MLVGREQQRAEIETLLDDLREGASRVLVVRGEPGIGKTALLAHAAECAGDAQVLRAGGVEFEAELPFATLHQLLRPIANRIDAIPEHQAEALAGALGLSSARAGDRFLLAAGVLSLLADAAEEAPLVCLLDDAQWMDRASREALLFAARRLEREGVGMVFAERAGIEDPLTGFPELVVSALAPEASGELLAERCEQTIALAVRDCLIDAAAGNPLALLELTGGLSEAQLNGAEPLPDPLPVSSGVEQQFSSRVSRLPVESRTALLIAAAESCGDLAAIERAGATLDLDVEALAAAESAGLIRLAEGRVRFTHPLARSAVYGSAPFTERRRAHNALAEALAGPEDADRRAWHRAATAASTDDAIASELDATAERARARGGYAAASDALERAASLTTDPESRTRRLVRAAQAAWLAGESAQAVALLERSEPLPEDPTLRGEVAWLRGLVEIHRGSPAAAADICLEVARQLASSDPAHALRLAALASIGASLGGDFGRIRGLYEWSRGLPCESVEEQFIVDFLEGLALICDANPSGAAAPFQRAVEAAALLDDERLLHLAGTAAAYRGDEREAERLYARAVERARTHGNISALPFSLTRLGTIELVLGKPAAAVADVTEALRLARETGQEVVVAHALSVLARLAAIRGDQTEATRLADEALAIAVPRRFAFAVSAAGTAYADIDLAAGRSAEAFERLRTLLAAPDAHPLYRQFAAPQLIEAGARAGRAAEVVGALDELEQWVGAADASLYRPVVARLRGLVARDGEAEQRFEDALELHAQYPQPLDRAQTELAYGEFLRRARRKSDARVPLRAALTTFEAHGLTPWAERAAAELRATGETIRRGPAYARAELTPQELQVARLAATGSTNKEIAGRLFLSPKTVEYHLRKVFVKLGITSRAELTALEPFDEPAVAVPAV